MFSPFDEDRLEDVAVLPRPGDLVDGKYRIEKVIGKGGMGVVYAAHHLILDQRVALKLLLVDALQGQETVERFLREAQAAARLRSDHVVRVMDAGALASGLPFLAMEYLEGCDLAELLSLEGPLPLGDTADYMLQALAALAQAHAAGIVHRDLKPANLFLALRADKTNILKILDFGISKQQSDRSHWKDLTGQAVLGTPVYISPEQLRSSKNVDPRADLWSLGIVMYELLTGKVPFDGDGPGEVFAAVLEKTPESVRVHRPDLPAAWEDAIMRCLQRSPDARFQDAGELAKVLAPLGSGRWAHLPGEIVQTLARPAASLPKEGVALVAAAVAAAHASMPPPGMSPVRITGAARELPTVNILAGNRPVERPTIDAPLVAILPPPPPPASVPSLPPPPENKAPTVVDKGQFVGVLPVGARAFGARWSRGSLTLVAGVLLIGIVASRGAHRTPRSGVLATAPSAAVAVDVAPPTPPAIAAPETSETGDVSPVSLASDVAPAAPASTVASPVASASAAPARPAPGRRAVAKPTKRSPGDARPKFLKSWP